MDPDSHQPIKCSLHDWATLRSQLLFTFDCGLPAGNTDGHFERHGEYSAWLVRRGWIRVEADGEEATGRPGEWLFCFGKRIEQKLSPDIRLFSVRMALSWPDESLMFQSQKKFCCFKAAQHPNLERIAKKLLADVGHVERRRENPAYTFLWRTRLDHAAYLRHQRHLLDWMELVTGILKKNGWSLRIPGGLDSRLAAVLFLLDNLPINEPFPAEKTITQGLLTIGQLNRMCLKACGTTLYGYWERRKIEHAKFMLEPSGSSIKEIASELGFSQLSHFSAWFKRHTTLSPRSFREGKTVAG